MLRLLTVLLTILSCSARAEDCTLQTQRALEELGSVFPDMDTEQRLEVQGILTRLCSESSAAPAADDGKAASATADPAAKDAEADAAKPESESFLGIEFERAGPDAKGRDRLRKTP